MNDVWEIVKVLIPIVLGVSGGFWFFIRKYIARVDTLEQRQNDKKVKIAVLESKLDDMKDDIKDIKHVVESIADKKRPYGR